jgi:hypothetical protein
VSALPELGAPAPIAEPLGEVRGPAVVAFLRHVGCPFAEATMRGLTEEAARHPEIAWVAVSHARLEATDQWCAAVGVSHRVRVVIDEERAAYGAWGLGLSSFGHFAGRRSLSAVAALARNGIRNRHPAGSRWQRAGTFAVNADGELVWRHIPKHAGALPDLAAAAVAASR